MKKIMLLLSLVIVMVTACRQNSGTPVTHHDLLMKMTKASFDDENGVLASKKAHIAEVISTVLDTIPVGQGLNAEQRHERAEQLTNELFDIMAENGVVMIEPYVKRYVNIDTLEQYVNAALAQPLFGLMNKSKRIQTEVTERISMDLLQLMGGDSLELPVVECSDSYRENFLKVMEMDNTTGLEDTQAAIIGADQLKAIRDYTNAAVLREFVANVSEDEMSELARFADLPCTKSYINTCRRMNQMMMAGVSGAMDDADSEDAQVFAEVAKNTAEMVGKMQRWFDENLEGASEDIMLEFMQ